MKRVMGCVVRMVVCAVLLVCGSGLAQSVGADGGPLKLVKVDPPNWWARMPKAMLLVQGEHLQGARFRLSGGRVGVERTVVSENGHWAQVWLAGSPEHAVTVDLVAERGGEVARMAYRFEERSGGKTGGDGFAGFSARDVMYLIMTDRFADGDQANDWQPGDVPEEKTLPRGWHGGDLRGVMEHLDYLQELGATTVWLTPVVQNHDAESYHGYGATDLYAVDEHFGRLEDLKALSAALHARGMKLVLDMVPNHVGKGHPWVLDEPAPDWLHGTLATHTEAQGDFAALMNPTAPWRDQKDVVQGWFANVLPDLNQESPAVAAYLKQNTVWWVEETKADGLRLDTFPYVGREFWQGFHAELHALYPRLTTVGEVFNADATITSWFAGGVKREGVDTGLDTPFDFPSYFALRETFVKDAPMTRLAAVLRLDALYPHPERLVPFLGNHDTVRFMGEKGATVARLKQAFVVLATMRGMPQIYSGDEIAMQGGEDPDNRRDFPGGFGGVGAFTQKGRSPEQEEVFAWVKGLLKLRKERAELQGGEEQVLEAKGGSLVYVRGLGLGKGCSAGPRVMVVVNNSDDAKNVTLPVTNTALEGCGGAETLWGKGKVSARNGVMTVGVEARESVMVGMR